MMPKELPTLQTTLVNDSINIDQNFTSEEAGYILHKALDSMTMDQRDEYKVSFIIYNYGQSNNSVHFL